MKPLIMVGGYCYCLRGLDIPLMDGGCGLEDVKRREHLKEMLFAVQKI
jgi:hypothetical protein